MQLNLSVTESQIIECSLHEGGDKNTLVEYRWLLLRIGWIIVNDTENIINLSEEDLWFLRDNIKPQMAVGDITGLDVIKKIYKLLLDVEMARSLNQELGISLMKRDEITYKEYREKEEYEDQVRNENNAQSAS